MFTNTSTLGRNRIFYSTKKELIIKECTNPVMELYWAKQREYFIPGFTAEEIDIMLHDVLVN